VSALSENTSVRAGLVMLAIGGVVSATLYVANIVNRVTRQEDRGSIQETHMNALDVKLDAIAQSVSEINVTLRERSSDYMSATDFRAWRRTFVHDNPTLLIPEWLK
jgi:hypothetical protein